MNKTLEVNKRYQPASHVGRMDHAGDVCVTFTERPDDEQDYQLDPRLDLVNHSPTGFAWGYAGSGPAQLALAILADATGSDQLALMLYGDFKWEVVCRFEHDWFIDQDVVLVWAGVKLQHLYPEPGKIVKVPATVAAQAGYEG